MAPATPEPMQEDKKEKEMTTEEKLQALIDEVTRLNGVINKQQEQLNRRQKEKGEIIRPKRPDDFGGEPSKMTKFFAELETYFGYYPETLKEDEDRVLFAANCLVGTAAEWFRPILADYNANHEGPTKMKEQTEEIFIKFGNFKGQIEKSFGTMNEEREAERELRFLRQKGALSKHTTTFLRLLTKVNWTEETKKEVYYNSVKSEVKDELFKENRSKIGFTEYTQKAIDIDNRNYERSQERKMDKHGYIPKTQANQGKKREDHVASSNDGRPGRMDIDTINSRKFKGTCNFCGKTGHKEIDCRSKQTCNFCGKKGHQEANCYTKKNGTTQKTTEKARVDAITEIPHESLSWTACYDDLCLVHKNSKDGSGYYPKKPRVRKNLATARIDTLNFYEQVLEGDSDFDAACENCGATEPRHICNTQRSPSPKIIYECDKCYSSDIKHDCQGCRECGSMEGYQHSCEAEFQQNMEAMYELFEEENKAVTEYYKEQQNQEKEDRNAQEHLYECELCQSANPDHDCNGCGVCGSRDPQHQCDHVLDMLVKENQRQEERRQYLQKNPPVQIQLPNASHARKPDTTAYDRDCGEEDWELCDDLYCDKHRLLKLMDWHAYNQQEPEKCEAEHFLDCKIQYCRLHNWKKHQFRRITRRLSNRGYNFNTHTNHGEGSQYLIKQYHRMTRDRNNKQKCQWCKKYQGKATSWQESHLDKINIDSIGYTNRKLLIEGYINQHPVTIYVDSGADRNLITPSKVLELQLPYNAKKRPTYVSSVVHPEHEIIIKYETDHLPLTINQRTEEIQFDVMELDTCDIMLGHPWLEQSNPLINWKTKEILWKEDVPQKL